MISVLIVDDDKNSRTGLSMIIPWEKYNMHVIGEAANGESGLEFLRSNKTDIAFVDISMPVMNGIEMIKEAHKEKIPTQYVVLSCHEDFDFVREAFLLGILDYVPKEQMEADDCYEVFQRIRDKYKMANEALEEDEETEARLKTEFDGLLWVFDHYQFSIVSREVSGWEGNIRTLERIISSESARTSNTFGIKSLNIPYFSDIDKAGKYIWDLRNYFLEQVSESTDNYAVMYQAVKFVWDHYGESILALDAANHVNYNRSYFSVVFRKTIGINFNLFLRRERIYHAMNYFDEGGKDMEKAASIAGYNDIRVFRKAFFEVTGRNIKDLL